MVHPLTPALGLALNLDARLEPAALELALGGDYVEYSAPLNLEAARGSAAFLRLEGDRSTRPLLFHPVHLNLWGPELEPLARLEELAAHLAAVGSPWVSNDVAWWHVEERPFPGYLYLPPPLTWAGVETATAHALHVQSALPVPLLLENPALMSLEGELHVLDFMAQLQVRTGCKLILDVAHLFSHQLLRGLPLASGLDGFPLEAVVELHVAGGSLLRRSGAQIYADDHSQPIREEVFELLEVVVQRCSNLQAVTFEADGVPPAMIAEQWRRIRAVIGGAPPRALAAPAVLPTAIEALQCPAAWEVYRDRFEGAAASGPASAERTYRLAALAHELDRWWPMTRLMAAPDREELQSFQGSEEFRSQYRPGGPELAQSFGRYIRHRLASHPNPALEVVAAFETWLLARAPHGTSSGRSGSFPCDLSEAVAASIALRQRAAERLTWLELTASDLEPLRQAAAEAPRRPWPVGARWDREGLRPV